MSTKLLSKMQWMLCLSLLVSGCETIQIYDSKFCSVNGVVSNGAICTHTLNEKEELMTMDQFLDFLSANAQKPAALCLSAEDAGAMKDALETACRLLGKKCTYEVEKTIENIPPQR